MAIRNCEICNREYEQRGMEQVCGFSCYKIFRNRGINAMKSNKVLIDRDDLIVYKCYFQRELENTKTVPENLALQNLIYNINRYLGEEN